MSTINKTQTLALTARGQILALFIDYVTLGKLHKLSVPTFLHLPKGRRRMFAVLSKHMHKAPVTVPGSW